VIRSGETRVCGVEARPASAAAKHSGSRRARGQALIEFAVMYSAVVLPMTFMVIFVAEMLWIWHGVGEFTRDGARFAATHCYQADSSNVIAYMQSHVPPVIDQAQFQNGQVTIQVQYFSSAADGSLTAFAQPPECGDCLPDSVSVSVANYQFTRLAGFLRLPPVTMPSFTTNLPMESAGFQDASGVCAAQ
jgi:hypothetical protein